MEGGQKIRSSNSGLCATDITHGLKLADDNQPKRNSENPTARQGKTETCKRPHGQSVFCTKEKCHRRQAGLPLWEAGLLSPPRPVLASTKQVFCSNHKGNTGINSELASQIQKRRNAGCLSKFSLEINMRF